MVDPISSIIHSYLDREKSIKEEDETVDRQRGPEKISPYYWSTLASLQPELTDESQSQDRIAQVTSNSITSALQGAWNWVVGFFTGTQPADNSSIPPEGQIDTSINGSPKLQEPGEIDKKKLYQVIVELNQHINRLKDMAEFEEEMRKTHSNTKSYRLDKMIINQYFSAYMRQKKSKEELGIEDQQHILHMHQENKQLHEQYFSLFDEIKSRSKLNSILGWVNLGTTIGIVGAIAVSAVIVGPSAILVIGLPGLSLIRGVVSGAEGILKYKNNLKTGQLFAIQEESTEHSNQIKVGLENMKLCNDDMAQILKTVREQLKNQSDAERMFRSAPAV